MGALAVSGLRPSIPNSVPPSVGSCTVVCIAVCPSLGVYTCLGFVLSTLPFLSRCPPTVALVPLYVTLYVHPRGRPSAFSRHTRRGFSRPKVSAVFRICATSSGPSVLDLFVLWRCASCTSIPRGLSTSSVLFPGPTFMQIPLVFCTGVACLRGSSPLSDRAM